MGLRILALVAQVREGSCNCFYNSSPLFDRVKCTTFSLTPIVEISFFAQELEEVIESTTIDIAPGNITANCFESNCQDVHLTGIVNVVDI
jgi:hypothetical protein